MSSFPIAVDLPTILTVAFYLLAMLYTIFSTILYYHWSQYAVSSHVRVVSLGLYFCLTLPLVGVMWMMIIVA